MTAQQVIALFGRQGHGKTTVMNKVTGSRFLVSSGARSCTTHLQFNPTVQRGILCVDTPGFHASQDVAQHVASQKIALEDVQLSGVYVVVKHARADDISEMLGNVMDFLGDDVRIIVTHEDVAEQGEGYDKDELKQMLTARLGVPTGQIVTVGRDTPASTIEDFIVSTLHKPRYYTVNMDQLSCLASLCIGPRAVEKRIQVVYAKISAASFACQNLVRSGKSRQTDSVIALVQHDTTEMVKTAKEALFRWAYEELSADQQHIVWGKVGLRLSMRLKEFVETTNGFLSYDVTADLSDYRKCPFCERVFVKVEGCGAVTCGNVPTIREPKVRYHRTVTTSFVPNANGWLLQFLFEGDDVSPERLYTLICDRLKVDTLEPASDTAGAGCGRGLNWLQMPRLSPQELKSIGLGTAELLRSNDLEELVRSGFEESVRAHEETQRQALADAVLGQR